MEIIGEIKMVAYEGIRNLISNEEAIQAYQKILELEKEGKDVFVISSHEWNASFLREHNIPRTSGTKLWRSIKLPILYGQSIGGHIRYEGDGGKVYEIVQETFDDQSSLLQYADSQLKNPERIAYSLQVGLDLSEDQSKSIIIHEADDFYQPLNDVEDEEALERLEALVEAAHSGEVDRNLILIKSFWGGGGRFGSSGLNRDLFLSEDQIRDLGFEIMYLGVEK